MASSTGATLVDQQPSLATAEPGLVGKLMRWLKQLFGGASTGPSGSAAQSTESLAVDADDNAPFVLAPGGYHIRVFNPSEIPPAVGDLVEEVREGLNLLPPLPQVVTELLREIQDSTSTSGTVAAVASSDPALAASLLRTVNGAASGLSRKFTSVTEAVSYLGFGVVRSLVLKLRLEQVLPASTPQAAAEAENLWVHSLLVAYLADALAEAVGGVDRGFVWTLGLLHDVGKLAVASRFPEKSAAMRAASHTGEGRLDRERRILGADHATVGGTLALKWKLPADLVQAIRWHEFPSRAFRPSDPPALTRALHVVYVANQLAKFCYPYSDEMELSDLPTEMMAQLGLEDRLTDLLGSSPLASRLRAAAGKALVFAAENSSNSGGSLRRLITFHEGDAAAHLPHSDRPTTAVRVEPELAGVELKQSAAAISDALKSLDLPASSAGSVRLVTRSILASIPAGQPVVGSIASEGSGARLQISSPWLAFARRFGSVAPEIGADALARELAPVMNLGWADDIHVSPDGTTVSMRLGAAGSAHASTRRITSQAA